MRRRSWFLAALSLTLTLAGCLRGDLIVNGGTGSNASGTGSNSGPPVSSSGVIAVGTISRFGSVIVNGVEYSSSGANITVDGLSNGSETALQLGMVVTVQGTMNSGSTTNGTAASITYRPVLRGAADGAPSVSGNTGTFTIHGLIVQTDETTLFDNTQGLAAIVAGTVVEVSGYRDASGSIRATRVAQTTSGNGEAVQGSISGVTGTTFQIGSLTVNYASATRTNIPAGGLINGLIVQVTSAAAPQSGVLLASSVSVQATGVNASDGAQAQLEGVVDGLSGSSFKLNGQGVSVSTTTTFLNGSSSGLFNGQLVQVVGTLRGEVVLASSVRFVPSADSFLSTAVTAVDTNNSSVTVFGVPGIVANVDRFTTFGDTSSSKARPFNLNNLTTGDHVTIQGVHTATNTLSATRLLRTDPGSQVLLKGTVDSAAVPTLTILGINSGSDSSTVFLDSNGNALTQLQFFSQVAPGSIVAVEGTFSGTAIAATQVRFGP